jgi:hypothetical protein
VIARWYATVRKGKRLPDFRIRAALAAGVGRGHDPDTGVQGEADLTIRLYGGGGRSTGLG